MPLTIPAIDDRKYEELRDEGLGRIRVHNPEWTNFHKSDPGVTLVEVFAFLTESLLYRANRIPERNRRKFLKLLGVPLAPATAAHGFVAFSNDRGPLETTTSKKRCSTLRPTSADFSGWNCVPTTLPASMAAQKSCS